MNCSLSELPARDRRFKSAIKRHGPFRVHFAGDMACHTTFLGNAHLAHDIANQSGDRYECVLPMPPSIAQEDAWHVRCTDLKQVMSCDLFVGNFDGVRPDPRSVDQFMMAKMLDITALLLRTDDGNGAGTNLWQSMKAEYPRTTDLVVPMMDAKLRTFGSGTLYGPLRDELAGFYLELAQRVIQELDSLREQPSIVKVPKAETIYRWALKFTGGNATELFSNEEVRRIIQRKRELRLL